MVTLYGTLLQPRAADDCQVTREAIVRIDRDGRIAEVGSGKTSAGDVIGGDDCWILPGFVDAHLHVPQWDRRGIDGLALSEWYNEVVYPAEIRMKDAAFAERLAEELVSGLIACGTTTVAAFGSPFTMATDRTFGVFARRGLRAIFGKMLNDAGCPQELCQPTEQSLEESRSLAAKWHGKEEGRLNYAFCLRVSTCCSEQLMRGVVTLSEMLNCHIQTHVAESLEEIAAVRDKFPERLDEIDLFAEVGLLSPRTLLGHGVFFDQQARHQVAETRSVLVHCPTANLFLESGLMDYVADRAAGVRIALGSSIASGHDPFMPRVAIECLQTAKALKVHAIPRRAHRVPSPKEAWWAITRGAAEALNMGDRVGSIEAGFEADCLVVRPEGWIKDLPEDQQISALLYTITPRQIEHVFIAGRRVGPT